MKTYYYTAYNLRIESEIFCPNLLSVSNAKESNIANNIDVHIRFGDVPETLKNPVSKGVLYQASPNQFLLNMTEIGGFWVRDGKEVIISPAPEATNDEVLLFLFGSVFGALLHQRGVLVLHASAIETPNGAALFVGASGSGKSTTAAAFHQRGYRVLSDDVCALVLNDANCPLVLPAFPQIKMWADSAEKLAYKTEGLRKVRPQLEKYALLLDKNFVTTSKTLYAVYSLSNHNKREFKVEAVKDASKFGILLDNTYRSRFMDGLKMRVSHFQLATAVANSVKMRHIIRPSVPFLLDELIFLIQDDFSKDGKSILE